MQPFKHQIDGVYFAMLKNGNAFFKWDMGIGKTRGALMLYERLRTINTGLKLLVVCPKKLIENAWAEDIKTFTPYKYVNLCEKKVVNDADIYLIGYEALISDKSNTFLVELLNSGDFMAVLDESSRLKNHKSKTAKKLLAMREAFKYRLAMSATPAPNNHAEWWAQVSFVNPEIFPKTYYAFESQYFCFARGKYFKRGAFFTRTERQEMLSSGWEMVLDPDKKSSFFKKLSQAVHYVNKRDCLDLPPTQDVVRRFELSEAEREAHESLKRNLVLNKDQYTVTTELAIKNVMKLRQITSGFVIDDLGQTRQFDGLSKKQELLEVLEEIGNKQVIIWVNFKHEVELLKDLPSHGVVAGGSDESAIADFKNGKLQYLLINPRSGAHGLTFINCHYQIFFSLTYSYELYDQSRGRTDRAGQTESTVYIHLVAENTIDEDVLDVVKGKKGIAEIVNSYLRGGRKQGRASDAGAPLPACVGAQAH